MGRPFPLNPSLNHSLLPDGHDYVVAHLTLPNNMQTNALINAQGNRKISSESDGLKHKYSLILDPLKYRVIGALKYQIKQSISDCVVWNDGCNTCQVRDGVQIGCTRMMCFRQGTPHCLVYGNH